MPHVKFDGSGFIGLRNFALFCCRFFFYGQDIFDRNIISIILHCHWCWYNIFLMKIISSEDYIPQCDFKLPDVCDVTEMMYVLRTGHFFVTLSSVFWDINLYPAIQVSHTTGYFY